jgi:hypothetical protein
MIGSAVTSASGASQPQVFTALCKLGRVLQEGGYSFVTPTPLTIERVNTRPENATARSLRDFFGWSRPAPPDLLPPAIASLARRAGILEERGSLVASRVRFSTLSGMLFVHSAFPTLSPDSVFFGPDTYRFAGLVKRTIAGLATPPRSVLDLGCGSGAGGIVASCAAANRPFVVLSDINEVALRLARVNARMADTAAITVAADVCAAFAASARQKFDLIIANPPYLRDPARRLYRDGGGAFGEALALRLTVGRRRCGFSASGKTTISAISTGGCSPRVTRCGSSPAKRMRPGCSPASCREPTIGAASCTGSAPPAVRA